MVRLTAWVVALAGSAVWLWSGVGWAPTPEEQLMSVVRAVAASLATWLLVATLLAVAARLLRVRWLAALAPAGVRRLVAGTLAGAVLLSPGVAGASVGATAPPPGVEVPVLDRVEATTATTSVTTSPAPAAQPSPPVSEVHLVEPGDSLWHIAAEELADRLGHEPSDAEVIPYWRRLIDANRHVVGDNPSLIRPGQQIDLPS